MISVNLDPGGNLTHFIAVPPQVDEPIEKSPPPDWSALFAAAGLDQATFSLVESTWRPPTAADARAAWTGTFPDQPDVPMRIEAASYRGKPVYFALFGPWSQFWLPGAVRQNIGERIQNAMTLFFAFAIFAGALLMVRYNLRNGRGDRRGAAKIGVFMLLVSLLGWAFGASHTLTQMEVLNFFVMGVGPALLLGGVFWLLYIALEPHVRRRLPHTIISWSRVLSGDWRDPLVGRDVLVGVFFGVVFSLFDSLENFARLLLTAMPNQGLGVWPSVRYLIAAGFNSLTTAMLSALFLFFLLFLLRLLTRRQWLAAAIFFLLGFTQTMLGSSDPKITFLFAFFGIGLWVFVSVRFGLLAMAVSVYTNALLSSAPFTTDFSAWYTTSMFVALAIVLAVAGFSFHVSLGGQKLFAGNLLEE
jgi:serine/threonine-protein kinase